MSLFKRALLYTIRKKGKSLIIFLVLLIVSTFTLTGLAVKEAAGTAALNLRHSLGGSFTIKRDINNSSKYKPAKGADGSKTYVYTGAYINDEMAKKVTGVSGIDHYNLESDSNADYRDGNSKYLELIKTNDLLADDPDMSHQAQIIGTLNSQYVDYFANRTFTLAQGSHITANDKNTALISSDLAKLNGLKLGDTIELAMNSEIATGYSSHANDKVSLKIIGIFDIAQQKSSSKLTTSYDLLQNRVIFDISSYQKLVGWSEDGGYQYLQCFVKDPAQIDNIINKIKNIDGIDWSSFQITVDDSNYQSAAAPLFNLIKIITTLIIIIILVSIAVLSLILTMWIKNRVHETGVLLSIGISKSKIILQYIVEVLMIAVVAFGLSYFLGMGLSQGLGNTITKYANMQLSLTILPTNLLCIYGIGTIIIAVSVLISSLSILRLKPKEILTKMS